MSRGRGWGRACCVLACGALAPALLPSPAQGDISGFVNVDNSGSPGAAIAGARVQLRAASATFTTTAADGSFTLAVNPAGTVEVNAAVAYDRNASTNYLIGAASASNGATGLQILLKVLPTVTNAAYDPTTEATADGNCGNCHDTGDGNSPFPQWQTSNHAGAAVNEWVLDLYSGSGTPGGAAGYVFRDTHPGETGFCATCHAPMEDLAQPGLTYLDEVSTPGGLEGVTCVSCHQMDSVNPANLNALHFVGGKSTYRFPDGAGDASTDQYVWGPLPDASTGAMRASYSTLHKDSRLCASCHQYVNPDTGAPGQNTYVEWQGSTFAVPGPGFKTCQDCHMAPSNVTPGRVCSFSPDDRPAEERRLHTFVGSTPDTLQNNLGLSLNVLEVGPGLIRATADVDNFGAGHSFPTGIGIRNAILVLEATYSGGSIQQVSGPTVPYWGSDDVAGVQPGDLAGAPGKGFAKVLAGRINGTGPVVEPVLFIDAESSTNTTIASGAIDTTQVEFQLPPGVPSGTAVTVQARLLYRRAFRALQVTKGWTESAHGGPIEIEVAARQGQVISGGTPALIEVPTVSGLGLAGLAALLVAAGVWTLGRSRG